MKTFLSFVGKETRHIVRDRRTMLILFGMPVMMMLLLGFAVRTDVKEVRTVVVTASADHLTRRLVAELAATEHFTLVGTAPTAASAERLIRCQRADMAVVFSPSFAARLAKGEGRVQLITDGADPNMARQYTNYARSIFMQAFAGGRAAGAGAGLAVLSLVLVFWVRGRLHEIGILLSIGTSKRQIIGQFLAELAIIAAVSSVFALGIGSVASSQISTALTAQTDQSQRIEKTVVQAAPPATYLQAFAFGYMVVLLSAIAATAPIMRQSPKQILAKLS